MLELRLLSQARVVLDGTAVTDFVSDKALALVCYLALNEGPQSRERLAGMLWGEKTGKRARASLRVALHNVQQLLPGYFEVTRKRAAFAHGRAHWIDVAAFEASAEHGDNPQALEEAVALYQDDFLAGLTLDDAPEAEAWLRGEQERLRLLLLQSLGALADHYAERADWRAATTVLRRLLSIEPWREQAHRQLMLLLARQEEWAAALAQYEQCRQILAEDLGVEPMAETDALYERIQRLRTQPRNNLPEQATTLLGREKELAQLQELLADGEVRLLSIVGLGGVGKTRLAVEAAKAASARFLDGTFFVPLTGLSSAAYLASAVAGAIGYQFSGERSQDEQVVDYLRDKELLLILDNYEHLLPDTSLVVQILEAAPDVKLIVTSRERLRLRWEWLMEVEGLAVEAPSQATADAPQLFLYHSRRLSPDFDPQTAERQAIDEICRFVGGLPLAIELAAAGIRLFAADQLVERLHHSLEILAAPASDIPERHRSMRAVFDHSWQLLQPSERDILARLSVFRASFDIAAAEAVAGATAPMLLSLMDKSLLVRQGDGRYGWHELLRQYASKKLWEKPENAAESVKRHYRHYAGIVEAVGMEGIFDPENVQKLARTMENIRHAWQAAATEGNYEILARMTPALATFFYGSDRWQEGKTIFAETIALLRPAMSNSGEPALQRLLGNLLSWQALYMVSSSPEESARIADEAVGLLRPLQKPADLGHALTTRADAVRQIGQVQEAIVDLEEVLRTVPAEENPVLYLGALHRAALAHLQDANYERAHTYGQRYLETARTVGFDQSIAYGLRVLGRVSWALDEDEEANSSLDEALEVARRSGRQTVIADVLFDLSRFACEQDDFERASGYLEQVENMEKLLRDFPSHRRDLAIERGIVAAGLGQANEARRHFRDGLSLLRDSQRLPRLLYLALHAGLLLEAEQAIEIASMVHHHPASGALTARRAGEELRKLSSGLPDDLVQAAIRRGREQKRASELVALIDAKLGQLEQSS
ncbi:MAG: BTAD domain-containing putative transcriptional regulator [Candidatus Promineifilaceae bacterium]|nr:BTAD domain-containing putative transcriptional regulator [Candidatus Promineifilaceae bacterium]